MSLSQSIQICALPGCDNPVPPQTVDARRRRNYCSNACRQKAYRDRHHILIKRNETSVTFWEQAVDAIDHLTLAQLYTLKQRIDAKLGIIKTTGAGSDKSTESPAPARSTLARQTPSAQATLLALRKGRGVIHLAVNHHLTLCGKDAHDMHAASDIDGNTCQRCCKVRDTQTWWQGWAEAFDDTVYTTGNE